MYKINTAISDKWCEKLGHNPTWTVVMANYLCWKAKCPVFEPAFYLPWLKFNPFTDTKILGVLRLGQWLYLRYLAKNNLWREYASCSPGTLIMTSIDVSVRQGVKFLEMLQLLWKSITISGTKSRTNGNNVRTGYHINDHDQLLLLLPPVKNFPFIVGKYLFHYRLVVL